MIYIGYRGILCLALLARAAAEEPFSNGTFTSGTPHLSEEEKLRVQQELESWTQENGVCTNEVCPFLSQATPELMHGLGFTDYSDHKPELPQVPFVDYSSIRLEITTVWHNIRDSWGDGGLSNARIYASMEFLNKAFAPAGIYFELGRIVPTDNDSYYTSATQGGPAERSMKKQLKKGNQAVLNIYSVNIYPQSYVAGYATYPWFYDGRNFMDGVVIDIGVLPAGDVPELNQGDILIHEVGHWMGLYDVFEGGCVGNGDYVDDTYPQQTATFGCPFKQNSCPGGGRDNIHNYMDNSNNECMSEFTQGQFDRMTQCYAQYRTLMAPTAPVPTAPTPGTTPRPTPGPTPSPAPTPPAPGICFSNQATVPVLDQGPIEMPNLTTGSKVLTANGYQTLYAFAHQDSQTQEEFLQFHTKQYPHNPLEISPEHMLFVVGKTRAVPARSIRVGDVLQSSQWPDGVEVKKIAATLRRGLYAPLTTDGTIVVDGIVSSCYIALQETVAAGEHLEFKGGMSTGLSQHFMAHLAMSPVRMACLGISSELCKAYDPEGMAYFAKFGLDFAQFADQQSLPTQVLLLVLYLGVFGSLYAVECLVGPQLALVVVLVGCAAGLGRLCPVHRHGKSKKKLE